MATEVRTTQVVREVIVQLTKPNFVIDRTSKVEPNPVVFDQVTVKGNTNSAY